MTLPANPTIQGANVELGRAAGFVCDMNTDVALRVLGLVSVTPGVTWQMSSLANRQASNPALTVAIDGPGPNYGYGPTFGAIAPNAVLGTTVFGIWGSGVGDMSINLNGNLPQNFWSKMMLRTNVNSAPFWITDSAAASSYSPGGVTQWYFAGGFNWPALNGSSPIVTFVK